MNVFFGQQIDGEGVALLANARASSGVRLFGFTVRDCFIGIVWWPRAERAGKGTR